MSESELNEILGNEFGSGTTDAVEVPSSETVEFLCAPSEAALGAGTGEWVVTELPVAAPPPPLTPLPVGYRRRNKISLNMDKLPVRGDKFIN